MDQRS
jgi:integrase